jgi:hypothetical protein
VNGVPDRTVIDNCGANPLGIEAANVIRTFPGDGRLIKKNMNNMSRSITAPPSG